MHQRSENQLRTAQQRNVIAYDGSRYVTIAEREHVVSLFLSVCGGGKVGRRVPVSITRDGNRYRFPAEVFSNMQEWKRLSQRKSIFARGLVDVWMRSGEKLGNYQLASFRSTCLFMSESTNLAEWFFTQWLAKRASSIALIRVQPFCCFLHPKEAPHSQNSRLIFFNNDSCVIKFAEFLAQIDYQMLDERW